ncbi:hypothetical protein F5Y04DRAFT_278906 [Hypomontagnella monticulosa]|nr:hypothetical protein F5Y04DRAFT_278906 [Hypomontagnella monticulosa]
MAQQYEIPDELYQKLLLYVPDVDDYFLPITTGDEISYILKSFKESINHEGQRFKEYVSEIPLSERQDFLMRHPFKMLLTFCIPTRHLDLIRDVVSVYVEHFPEAIWGSREFGLLPVWRLVIELGYLDVFELLINMGAILPISELGAEYMAIALKARLGVRIAEWLHERGISSSMSFNHILNPDS